MEKHVETCTFKDLIYQYWICKERLKPYNLSNFKKSFLKDDYMPYLVWRKYRKLCECIWWAHEKLFAYNQKSQIVGECEKNWLNIGLDYLVRFTQGHFSFQNNLTCLRCNWNAEIKLSKLMHCHYSEAWKWKSRS